MKDFLKNIERTRNTEQQLEFYKKLGNLVENAEASMLAKMKSFPVFTPRQIIQSFVEKYEIYRLCINIPGSIVDCGTGAGFNLMTFAHLSAIFEPYHYVRKIIGFDTFEGFKGLTKNDLSSKASHMKKGGLNHGFYDILKEAIAIHDMNRPLGHLNKIEVVKGDICKTFPMYLKKNPSLVIALLYLDLDLYKPTLDTLKAALPRIPKGGIIAFDELNHSDYPGETIAVMDSVGIHKFKLRRLGISPMLSYAIID